MFIATLIAAARLRTDDILAACALLRGAGIDPGEPSPLDEGSAADILFHGDREVARAAFEQRLTGIDVIVQPVAGREKRLIVADMDSTMITIECIDELADYAGIKAEVAAVTERAMRGELDFEAALDERVRLLKGLATDVLDRCYRERVRIMPGAQTLVRTMAARGARTVLVSGGFTVFADRVAAEIGFDRALSNRLGVAGGRLDGSVARPIIGAETKKAELIAERDRLGLDPAFTLAIGDGANDIPMIQEAGLGVAYRAKPKTAAAAAARIDHNDLRALLWAQGIAQKDWQR